MDEIEPLFERVESYGFECEAGPLKNCVEWIELKRRVAEADRQRGRK